MFARQVCFRKVQYSTFDIDDSGDDENGVSVDDLLAQAATDPDNDGNASDEEWGPLSAGIALAPANINYCNTLLGIFYNTAQAARDCLNASGGDEPGDDRVNPPLSLQSLLLTSATSSQTTSSIQSQSLGQRSSNKDPPNWDDHSTSSARINSNGKRPHSTPLSVHDKENLEHPLPPVHVSNKRPRGGGPTMAGRGGHHKK
jgi:hypothetical protein